MSTLEVNTIAPLSSSSDVTLGGSSKNIKFASGTTVDFSTNSPTLTLGADMKMHGSFQAYRNDSQTVSADTWTKIQLNAEEYDTDSYFDSSTNYRYTPQVAGKYYIYGQTRSSVALTAHYSAIYKNGSKIHQAHQDGSVGSEVPIYSTVDMNGSTDYVELYAYYQGGSNSLHGQTMVYFGGFRIIGA